MKNVLFVTRCFVPTQGGMGRFALDLHTSIQSKARLYTLQWSGGKLALLIVLPIFFVRSFWMLLTKKIDIIHAQDGVVAILLKPLAMLFKKPLVTVIHGLDVTYKMPLFQWLVRWALTGSDHIICISSAARDEVLKRGVAATKTHVVPVGVTDDFYTGNKKEARTSINVEIPDCSGKTLLLSSGRLVERKGVAWFVRNVLPLVVKEVPSVLLVVSGEGPQRTAIEEAIAETNQQQYVRLLGWTSNDLLKRLYNAADCFVMPNIPVAGDMEGFGRVLIEAALCETPVVASGIEGITDAIIDGQNGILVPTGDEKQHAEQIIRIIKSPAMSQKIGQKARVFSLVAFGWPRIADDYIKIYNQTSKNT